MTLMSWPEMLKFRCLVFYQYRNIFKIGAVYILLILRAKISAINNKTTIIARLNFAVMDVK